MALGVLDEIVDNEVVIHIAHPLHRVHLVFQSFPKSLGRVLPIPSAQPLLALAAEKGGAVAARGVEGGQLGLAELQLHPAPPGDGRRVVKGLGYAGEERTHLRLGFEVKLLRFKGQRAGCIQSGVGADADKHPLRSGILPGQVMRIVGAHQRNPRFPG